VDRATCLTINKPQGRPPRLSKSCVTATGFSVKKPARFGKGTWMTVAVFDGDYRASGGKNELDWQYTATILATAEKVLKAAVHRYNAS
jgi:hypothetical protein